MFCSYAEIWELRILRVCCLATWQLDILRLSIPESKPRTRTACQSILSRCVFASNMRLRGATHGRNCLCGSASSACMHIRMRKVTPPTFFG
jgi:hypothetical protein